MKEQTLFWLFTGIFAVTAVITLLGITGVLKNIKDRYLNALFGALILEVVAAILMVFQQMNFEDKASIDLAAMITESGYSPPAAAERQDDFIISKLSELKQTSTTLSTTQAALNTAQSKIASQATELEKCSEKGNSFYSKITQLDGIIEKYKQEGKGKSINIQFQPEQKVEVFQLLLSIFSYIERVQEGDGSTNPDGTVNIKKLQRLYAQFKATYMNDEQKYMYIGEADLSQMVQAKLKLDN